MRAWGLGEALHESGCRVSYLVPETLVQRAEGWDALDVIPFPEHDLDRTLAETQADLLVVEQWQPLTLLRERPPLPTAIDLPGPLLLEYAWREPDALARHYADKLRCLAMADGLITALPEQRGYVTAWALAAGLDVREGNIRTVPFCLPAMPRSRQGARNEPASFLSAGLFWPWQEIEPGLRMILDRLQNAGAGQISVVGGQHPHHAPGGQTDSTPTLPDDLAEHPHLSHIGLLPFSELMEELRRSTVAIDLGAKTLERELALAVRTGVALWAGCPAMVRPWSIWAPLVERHNAGWVIDDLDSRSFRKLIDDLAQANVDVSAKRRGVVNLVETEMRPDTCIRELLDWAHDPPRRNAAPSLADDRFRQLDEEQIVLRRELDRVRHELERTQGDLDSIRSHALFKLYKRLFGAFSSKSDG